MLDGHAQPACGSPSEEASDALQAFSRRSDLADAKAKVAVDQHHLAARHNLVADDQDAGIGDMAVQLDHISRPQIEDLSERHLPAAEAQGGFKFDIEQQLEAWSQSGCRCRRFCRASRCGFRLGCRLLGP